MRCVFRSQLQLWVIMKLCNLSIMLTSWYRYFWNFTFSYLTSDQVSKVRQQEKLKYPPHPLNTIELEKRASRYFRMSSEHTMKVCSLVLWYIQQFHILSNWLLHNYRWNLNWNRSNRVQWLKGIKSKLWLWFSSFKSRLSLWKVL